MRLIYALIFTLFSPLVLLQQYWRTRDFQRLKGLLGMHFNQTPIWIHCASLGEVNAGAPLIQALALRYPQQILVTTLTRTGADRVQQLFGHTVNHRFLPLDLPMLARRFVKQVQPQIAIFLETELWPNYIYHLHRSHIPQLLLNARLTQKSIRAFVWIRPFIRKLLQNITCIATQSRRDAALYRFLGASRTQIRTVGNLKTAIQLSPQLRHLQENLRKHWPKRPTLCAASTHEGEETILLQAFQHLRQTFPDLLLVLVPRHPRRFETVAHIANSSDFQVHTRQQHHYPTPETDIFIVNTTGELTAFYGVSDIAFIGGSLVNIGGHNALEACLAKIPMITGPYTQHCQAINNALESAGALITVKNLTEFIKSCKNYLSHQALRDTAGTAGWRYLQGHNQVLTQYLNICSKFIDTARHRP